MKLAPCIRQFFDQYLPHIKGVSEHTVQAYRDAFRLFLPFAAKFYNIKIRSLRVEHLSSELIIAFLEDLQRERKNLVKTRNHRLAVLKSFAKMIRFKYPEQQEVAETILNIPQKRAQKPLIGFLYQDEILEVFQSVDLRTKEGFRDYALLHLLYDSAARATEIATLNLDYFDPQKMTLAILGKGNRFRLIQLKPKPCHLLQLYIRKYRISPQPPYQDRLFINQRGGNSPAMASTAFAGSISKRPYLLNVSSISIPSIAFVTAGPLTCTIVAMPSPTSRTIWDMTISNLPPYICIWISIEGATSKSALSGICNRS